MPSESLRQVAIALVLLGAGATGAVAQPKHKAESGTELSDKNMDKQMAWENKVMGEDRAKQADMKRIAAAQKLSDEARKHPAPEPAPKVKDPNKEGVRAKQEAAIGLPIASDEEDAARRAKKSAAMKKSTAPSSSANDELGALVASSLASDKAANAREEHATKSPAKGKGQTKRAAKPAPAPSSLDKMFGN